MASAAQIDYKIPLRYRRMENLHIVFWLFKDLAWCLFWKPLGVAMIFPTLIVSLIIAWRTRLIVSELCHNLAVSIWISANSYWMISEFLGFDEQPWFGQYTYKHIAIIPFVIGLAILSYYYLIWRVQKHSEEEETM
jgi:prepilin signal peptidase PulO-like enzyme (type II secretory pathway)